MSTNDNNVHQANEEGLDADAATQSDLWTGEEERHDDGYRRDEFGNRVNDDGTRVDPEGRPMDAGGNPVNQEGQRVDDEGRPMGQDDSGVIPGIIPTIPPMMGH